MVVEAAGVELRGRGRVRQGLCPLHEETAGSFTVYADTQRWYCFGCGLGGDVLDFIQRTDGVDLPEAIRRLEASSASPAVTVIPPQTPISPSPIADRDPSLLTAAMRCYRRQLELCGDAQAYLASRGIDSEAAQRLGLGYASGRELRDWLVQAGFDDRRILSSGLASEGRERFRGMIVVPELVGSRVHWLAGRAVWPRVRPRFQALPGSKPLLGLARLTPPVPGSWSPRGCSTGSCWPPGACPRSPRWALRDGQPGFLPTGTAAGLPRLRRRPGRARTRLVNSAPNSNAPRPSREPARRHRRRRRARPLPGRALHLPGVAAACGTSSSLAGPTGGIHPAHPATAQSPIEGPAHGLYLIVREHGHTRPLDSAAATHPEHITRTGA